MRHEPWVWVGKVPWKKHGYSCLERESHGLEGAGLESKCHKSWTQLKWLSMHKRSTILLQFSEWVSGHLVLVAWNFYRQRWKIKKKWKQSDWMKVEDSKCSIGLGSDIYNTSKQLCGIKSGHEFITNIMIKLKYFENFQIWHRHKEWVNTVEETVTIDLLDHIITTHIQLPAQCNKAKSSKLDKLFCLSFLRLCQQVNIIKPIHWIDTTGVQSSEF